MNEVKGKGVIPKRIMTVFIGKFLLCQYIYAIQSYMYFICTYAYDRCVGSPIRDTRGGPPKVSWTGPELPGTSAMYVKALRSEEVSRLGVTNTHSNIGQVLLTEAYF